MYSKNGAAGKFFGISYFDPALVTLFNQTYHDTIRKKGFSIHYYNQWTTIAIKFLIIAIFDANDQSFVLITIHKS